MQVNGEGIEEQGQNKTIVMPRAQFGGIWNWSNNILQTEQWDWSNIAVFGIVSITICHLCTQINGYYWFTAISSGGVALCYALLQTAQLRRWKPVTTHTQVVQTQRANCIRRLWHLSTFPFSVMTFPCTDCMSEKILQMLLHPSCSIPHPSQY